MLKKLMKYELQATARVMLPLYLLMLVLAGGTRLISSLFSGPLQWENVSGLLEFLLVLFSVALIVALVGIFVVTLVLSVGRFQKNLLGDEGYRMFTLPVSRHQLVWSKLIVSALWFVGSALVDGISLCILAVDSLPQLQFRAIFGSLNTEVFVNGTAATLEFILLLLLGLFSLCLSFYAPLAIGHSFPRHKMLLSVVFYFVLQIIYQVSAAALLLALGMIDSAALEVTSIHAVLWVCIAIVLVYGGVLYALTAGMLGKRLNLA